MGTVIDFTTRKRRRETPPQRTASSARSVVCAHCGERHPIARLRGGEDRCVTGFFDGAHWFCRNSGCRRAWLEQP